MASNSEDEKRINRARRAPNAKAEKRRKTREQQRLNRNIDQTGHQAKVTFTNQVGLTALNNVGFAEELGISHLNAHSMIGATA